mmetsp:Transcript_18200/g.41924  ORF Transcript_18200/g.41924 Transcript_18200/m.41924 type:complete len:1231 (+) Transcript_18200:296-3988(+)
MSKPRSNNPFDDDYEGFGEGDNVTNNTPVSSQFKNTILLGDEHPSKYTKSHQKRTAPLPFSNPFEDDAPRIRLPPPSPASPTYNNNSSYHSSPQQNFYPSGGEGGASTSSEWSPLLPDDLSRGLMSSNNSSSKGTPSGLGRIARRHISVPRRIFTGGEYSSSPSPHHRGTKRRPRNRRAQINTFPPPKSDVLMTELAGGDDHENDQESMFMEYKYILLEDLGTATSWIILVLPYATFGFSLLLLYFGLNPVPAMGSTMTVLRLSCCTVMLCFIMYWVRKMEMVRLTCCCCGNIGRTFWLKFKNLILDRDTDEPNRTGEIHWWENPWVLFPERYYILPLLLSSLLVLEPIPLVIFFFPSIETHTMNAIAEASSGAGIQVCAFIYLCLVQGFRYHSGTRSKRRAELQRKALKLRRAAKMLSDGKDNHKDFVKNPRIVQNYHEEVGDTDGITFAGHLRLPNDPCADGWADFLLPKMPLLLVGVLSTTIASFSRPSNGTLYSTGTIVYMMTLSIWAYLALVALYQTGERLKREPFLGTRPAQLAYRILFAHSGLAIVGLGVEFITYIRELQQSMQRGSIAMFISDGDGSLVPPGNVSLPLMFGRLVCLTVQVAITAFIFLPPRTMDVEDDDENELTDLQIQNKNRRDKRLVVPLAKDSKTWRIFPCPIQNCDYGGTNPFQDKTFQIYKDFHTEKNTQQRGLVSIGPYIPVFCAELACWLNEASWQAYNSPVGSPERKKQLGDKNQKEHDSRSNENDNGDFSGWMRLDNIGLQLEGYVYDEQTNTQAYIATNSAPQVYGDEDSIIVVAFRGTSDATNLKTDFRVRQVPLHDQITGIGESAFRVFTDHFEVSDADGWIWETDTGKGSVNDGEFITCVGCWSDDAPPCTPTHTPAMPTHEGRQRLYSVGGMEGVVSKETADLLKVAPLARNTFPMVHEGFQDVYSKIRKRLFDLLLPVLQRQLAKSVHVSQGAGKAHPVNSAEAKEPLALPKIYCTGHSLGGSLAQLFALDLASNCELILPLKDPPQPKTPKSPFGVASEPKHTRFFPLTSPAPRRNPLQKQELKVQPPIGVYTYGQPRVGNRAFSRLYKQKVPHSFRVVNEGDAFTTIPNYLWCGGLYKHAGLEVILDGGMTGNVLVGPTVVETLFRFHKVRTNVMAHQMERYRECLECIFDDSQLLQYYKDHNIAYEEFLADRKISRESDEAGKRKTRSTEDKTVNDPWADGELSRKVGLEWYNG